jgi:hypothetical protein
VISEFTFLFTFYLGGFLKILVYATPIQLVSMELVGLCAAIVPFRKPELFRRVTATIRRSSRRRNSFLRRMKMGLSARRGLVGRRRRGDEDRVLDACGCRRGACVIRRGRFESFAR